MSIKNKINNYLMDNEFRMIYYNNFLNINNYLEILDFSSSIIKIKYIDGTIIINGNNLCISKMIDNELLINGVIKSISLS